MNKVFGATARFCFLCCVARVEAPKRFQNFSKSRWRKLFFGESSSFLKMSTFIFFSWSANFLIFTSSRRVSTIPIKKSAWKIAASYRKNHFKVDKKSGEKQYFHYFTINAKTCCQTRAQV